MVSMGLQFGTDSLKLYHAFNLLKSDISAKYSALENNNYRYMPENGIYGVVIL